MPIEDPVSNSSSQIEKPDLPTILVVDDLLDNLIVFQKLIEKNLKTHRVLMCNNPLESLKMAAEHLPDVILLDFQMPEINGLELCRKLKADPVLRQIPVLLISAALVTKKLKEEGRRAGAVDFLVKPIDMSDLSAKLCTAIQNKNAFNQPQKPGRSLPYVENTGTHSQR